MMTTMMTLVAILLQPILLQSILGTTNSQVEVGTRRLPAISGVQPLLLLMFPLHIFVVQEDDSVLADHSSSMMTLVAILLQPILLQSILGTTNSQVEVGTRRLPAISGVQPLLLLMFPLHIFVVQEDDSVLASRDQRKFSKTFYFYMFCSIN